MVFSAVAEMASLAAIRDRNRLGIAMAATIRMIPTTIISSIREKPFCRRIRYWSPCLPSLVKLILGPPLQWQANGMPNSSRTLKQTKPIHYFIAFQLVINHPHKKGNSYSGALFDTGTIMQCHYLSAGESFFAFPTLSRRPFKE